MYKPAVAAKKNSLLILFKLNSQHNVMINMV